MRREIPGGMEGLMLKLTREKLKGPMDFDVPECYGREKYAPSLTNRGK